MLTPVWFILVAIAIPVSGEELKYREKHQESPLFWNELASSYFRTSGNLLETVLTVGVVAWMTMSPKRKLIN
ncbi:hypothetical protein MRX96_007899 [Rhipicephalus microplus]